MYFTFSVAMITVIIAITNQIKRTKSMKQKTNRYLHPVLLEIFCDGGIKSRVFDTIKDENT